jgi:lysozyme family protein
MDRNFARALPLVLKHEGGWADHPRDPGGATMKGVTLASNPTDGCL